MDITSIVGIIIAVIGVLGGMYFKEVSFSVLANPAALFIIIIGTIGAVMNATPKKDLGKIGSLFKLALMGQKGADNVALVKMFIDYSKIVIKDGALALQDAIMRADDPFQRWAMGWLLTGQKPEVVREALETELDNIDTRHRGLANIFSQAGSYAPTLGVLGAVVGLVAAMGFLDDTEQLAHAISGAFMATVYGIFTGYVLWNPFSNRLKRMNANEMNTKRLIAEGVMLLLQESGPAVVEDYLTAYLTTKEGASFKKA